MRGGKDEEKVISPMFPRLHVNDTERGGPRAPPRNKMALYEQLSVPSQQQRISSGSGTLLPLPATNGASTLVPSTSSSTLGGGREKSQITPFCNPSVPSNPTEKLHFHSSTRANSNSTVASHDSTKPTDYQRSLNATRQLQSVAKGHLFQPPNFHNFRNLSLKKHGGEDAVTVPTFSLSHTQQREDREHQFPLFRTASSVHTKGNGTVDPNSRQHVMNQSGDNPKVGQTRQDPLDRPISIPSSRDKILVDSFPTFSTKERNSGSLKRAHESSEQNHKSLLEAVTKRRGTDARLVQEAVAVRDKTALLEDGLKGMERDNALKVTSEKHSRPAAGGNDGHDRLVNGSKCHEDKECGSAQVGEADKNNDTLDSSMVDSVSVLDVSPDDVVGVIGEKQFWKARRAIVNQQRVFAEQLFELHRLIKVQRLIAESPHLLLEDTLSLGKHSSKGSLVKKLSSESVLEPSPTIGKPRNGSQNPNDETECLGESALPKLPLPLPLPLPLSLPLVNEETSKGLASHISFYGPYSGNQPPQPLTPNGKPSPWCFQPPSGNQWLIPVLSPSEGFVYKPYTGPGPPNPGLMASIYGNYDPMNTGFGVLASHQQGIGVLPGTSPLGQTYFPPYGMPMINPSASGSAVEQVSPLAKAQSEDQPSNVDIDLAMSSQMSRVVSCRVRKQSELQGSTASSPPARINGEALPLFPLASDLNTSEPPAKVIKVVPHNPRSATESAARIFQFIQEERKQFD